MLFASLGERLGADRCVVRVPPGAAPADLWPLLPDPIRRERAPTGARYAINDTWATDKARLAAGDRVAIILPVSGG
jgi:molybdopterin converting factor small subunit